MKTLDEILTLHQQWLRDKETGSRADLSDTDLRYVNLSDADLSDADLRGTDLRGTDLRGANLSDADLSDADLRGANLKGANLSDVDLRGANLRGANLRGADLRGVFVDSATKFYFLQCPEKGSYYGFKKCKGERIVELLIPEDAKRSSATTRKCRASKAKVLNITDFSGEEYYNEAVSVYDDSFVYRAGETVEVKDFNEDRWVECGTGIHHFITRDEAIIY